MARSKSSGKYPKEIVEKALSYVFPKSAGFSLITALGEIEGEYGVYAEPHFDVDNPYILVRPYLFAEEGFNVDSIARALNLLHPSENYSFKNFWPGGIQEKSNMFTGKPLEGTTQYLPEYTPGDLKRYKREVRITIRELGKLGKAYLPVLKLYLDLLPVLPEGNVKIEIKE